MADPLADHEHNTLTTLKLFEALKDHDAAAAGRLRVGRLHRGREDLRGRGGHAGGRPGLALPDSPYQISKIVGEYYSNYYLAATACPSSRPASRTSTAPARCWARGSGAARSTRSGATSRRLHLQGAQARGAAGRERRHRQPRPDLRRGHGARADRLRHARGGGEVYNLASGVETTIRELAELINELAGNPTPIALTPARDWDHSGQRYGDRTRPGASWASRRRAAARRPRGARSPGRARTSTGSRAACRPRGAHRPSSPAQPPWPLNALAPGRGVSALPSGAQRAGVVQPPDRGLRLGEAPQVRTPGLTPPRRGRVLAPSHRLHRTGCPDQIAEPTAVGQTARVALCSYPLFREFSGLWGRTTVRCCSTTDAAPAATWSGSRSTRVLRTVVGLDCRRAGAGRRPTSRCTVDPARIS